MDPALLEAVHGPAWTRLSTLSRSTRMSSAEVDEFLRLYRAASKDLSRIRTTAPDSEEAVRLSRIVHRARLQLGSVPHGPVNALTRFFLVGFPLSLYRLRWVFLGVFAYFLLVSVGSTVWALTTPGVMDTLGSDAAQEQHAGEDFVEYYFEHPNGIFAIGVWINNAWIAFQWVLFGITGIYVLAGLTMNALNLGVSAAIMFDRGYGADFWAYILPHGIPEITCILIAAAAGLQIFAAWIVPSAMTRREALAQASRSLVTVALGLVLCLFLSGLIEGFVTPSSLPVPLRISIGFLLAAGIWAYAFALGRPAHLAGASADLTEDKAGHRRLVVD